MHVRNALAIAVAALLLAVPTVAVAQQPPQAPTRAAQADSGFTLQTVFSGLNLPTVVRFSPDGRVFVAEKDGLVKVFDSLTDPTPTTAIDLRSEVYDYWDRGLLGMALDPNFPASPYVYLLYTWDRYHYDDDCPTPPGSTTDGCLADGRLVRVPVDANDVAGTPQVLLDGGFCQQFPSHSMGTIEFGPEGALYVTAGEGASFYGVDSGQLGGSLAGTPTPRNPCGDPPSEGGALRSQDVRTTTDPLGYNGAVLRLDPTTGAAWPGNPGRRRIIAHGFRNPFRATIAPDGQVYVGDVGWDTWEEIDRIPDASSLRNFGWPCYEGPNRNGPYDAADIPLCESLYVQGTTAVSAPLFAYQHGVALDACPEVQGSSSAISGLAFYRGGSYPDAYDGALFFTDYSRACIWVMYRNAHGVPDPATVHRIATDEQSVGLYPGPGGDIFSVDLWNGLIRRVVFTGTANRAPTAAVVADPTSGSPPLTVHFDASGSTDPDGDVLQYSWDLDGDGRLNDAFGPTADFTYDAVGTYTVRLRVDDGHGGVDDKTLRVFAGTKPTATMVSPTSSTTWAVGDRVDLKGTGTDPQGGPLTYRWDLAVIHCSATPPFDCHNHPLQKIDGATASFFAPDHPYPSRLSITLTVTDPDGLTDSKTVEIQPRTKTITINTAPPGLRAFLGGSSVPEGRPQTTIERSRPTFSVLSPQTRGGYTYRFLRWTDGSSSPERTTTMSVDRTFTARFNGLPVAVVTARPKAGRAPLRVRLSATRSVDPEGRRLRYAWDLDHDGRFDDARRATVRKTFSRPGRKRVTVRVTDSHGAAATASVVIRVRPRRR